MRPDERNKTAPFELGRGDDACLLLHGFTGSPWDMRPLGEALAAAGFYVRAVRLPGHGRAAEALAHVSRRDWEQAAEDALLSLSQFRHVFVAGLSMGALLALLLAARHPSRVHGLALIAPALRLRERRLRVLSALRLLPLLPLIRPLVEKNLSDIEDPKARAQAPHLRRVPSARLQDVMTLQQDARAVLSQVQAASLIAIARHDHVVEPAGARELARGLTSAPLVRFIRVERGYHIMPRDLGQAVLLPEVVGFFERLRR